MDLAFGEEKQRELARALGDCHFECKSDQKARRTGFVFIETHQHGRPSGINVSTAGWWAIEVAEERWVLIRRVALKVIAQRSGAANGGDDDAYRGRLVPVRWLLAGLAES